jgi:hypothetical protein
MDIPETKVTHVRENRKVVKNGHSRDKGSIEHKKQKEDNQSKYSIQPIQQMSNTNPTKNQNKIEPKKQKTIQPTTKNNNKNK